MQLIRIFLSAPGDVAPERQKVKTVVEQLNRIYGKHLKIHLELLDWKTHVTPGMGRPQAVINEQIGPYDIFLGMMWKRFGTPTGVADSGTEEEFNLAYQNWQAYHRPEILFYFSQAPYNPLDLKDADFEQLNQVRAFKKRLATLGLIGEYPAVEKFSEILQEHLVDLLFKWFQSPRPPDFTRYLNYLKADTMYIDIRGLITGNQKGHQFRIDKLYIPLKTTTPMALKSRREPSESGLTASANSEIPLAVALKQPYLLIKGDPGAGKTTFLRLITFDLCTRWFGEVITIGDKPLEWPEPLPLPIFIRLGQLVEFIQHQQQNAAADTPAHAASPDWLLRFLAQRAQEYDWKVTAAQFKAEFQAGRALILLDGLDEAPDEKTRQQLSALANNLTLAYPKCQVVLTSRPAALEGKVLPAGFEAVEIAPLDEPTMLLFLTQWCVALYPTAPGKSQAHCDELSSALHSRPEIRRMAQTPVMLTALAVVHWNENKIPEQRAELYKSIIGWLLRSREQKPGRLNAKRCQKLLQLLALALFRHPKGRQRQVTLNWAAQQLQTKFEKTNAQTALELAEQFLREEMVDSGVIVERNRQLEFWHLSFQEYLAAVEIGGLEDADRIDLIYGQDRFLQSEWQEVMLLLAGVLADQGEEKMNHLVNAMIEREADQKLPEALPRLARVVGLLGGMLRDLKVVHFQPANPRYPELVQSVMGIFAPTTFRKIPVQVRVAAADALGQVGDPRLIADPMIEIAGGTFLMGAQDQDKNKPNYDETAYVDEAPVHSVTLSPFFISKYPITVGQYRRFVDAEGYQQSKYWTYGGFQKFNAPDKWDEQQNYPTRPVVYVSWYEAFAYCVWFTEFKGDGHVYRLPTEAEWERAARGPGADYRKYPWGDKAPDGETANYDQSEVGHASPVGIFPESCAPEGVIDLAGNVWEWCWDWYREKYYDECKKQGTMTNPLGPKTGSYRVARGGCWDDGAQGCRTADRDRGSPDDRGDDIGFRLVFVP